MSDYDLSNFPAIGAKWGVLAMLRNTVYKSALHVLSVFVLLAVANTAWAKVALHDVRIWAAPDHTRIVFDLGGSVRYKLFTLENPNRVVIDIRNAYGEKGQYQNIKGKGLISSVRTAVRNGKDIRVVLDVKGVVKHESFALAPNQQYGHRLVVDLSPTGKGVIVDDTPAPVIAEPSLPSTGQKFTPSLRVVAIDAGHGGEDLGARGARGTKEKDVVLSIARKVAKLVNAQPGMKAVLIRDGDYYIGLRERMVRARKHDADLFVSIHADAFRKRTARGGSVFVLSNRGASSEHARWLAQRENASDLVGGVTLKGKDSTLASVMLDLAQNASLEASFDVGDRILNEMGRIGHLHKRKVQQAGFMVLKSPDIPSVLVETAFISNRAEENKLRTGAYQQKMANAIFKGISGYFSTYRPMSGETIASNTGSITHKIRRGETLSEIAQQYRVSLNQLRNANKIRGDVVRVGQVLTIPTDS